MSEQNNRTSFPNIFPQNGGWLPRTWSWRPSPTRVMDDPGTFYWHIAYWRDHQGPKGWLACIRAFECGCGCPSHPKWWVPVSWMNCKDEFGHHFCSTYSFLLPTLPNSPYLPYKYVYYRSYTALDRHGIPWWSNGFLFNQNQNSWRKGSWLLCLWSIRVRRSVNPA